MHERYYTSSEMKIIEDCVRKEIPPSEIAAILNRKESAVRRKIYIMGLFYESKLKKIKKSKAIIEKYIKNKHLDEGDVEIILSKTKYIRDEWEVRLKTNQIYCELIKGTKVFFKAGRPISISEIMKLPAEVKYECKMRKEE